MVETAVDIFIVCPVVFLSPSVSVSPVIDVDVFFGWEVTTFPVDVVVSV